MLRSTSLSADHRASTLMTSREGRAAFTLTWLSLALAEEQTGIACLGDVHWSQPYCLTVPFATMLLKWMQAQSTLQPVCMRNCCIKYVAGLKILMYILCCPFTSAYDCTLPAKTCRTQCAVHLAAKFVHHAQRKETVHPPSLAMVTATVSVIDITEALSAYG